MAPGLPSPAGQPVQSHSRLLAPWPCPLALVTPGRVSDGLRNDPNRQSEAQQREPRRLQGLTLCPHKPGRRTGVHAARHEAPQASPGDPSSAPLSDSGGHSPNLSSSTSGLFRPQPLSQHPSRFPSAQGPLPDLSSANIQLYFPPEARVASPPSRLSSHRGCPHRPRF